MKSDHDGPGKMGGASMPPGDEPPGSGPPALTLTHHHPGRLRVRAPAFQAGDAAARVLAALEGARGVTAVKHKAHTGSILVEYEPGVAQAEAILSTIAAASGLGMPTEDLHFGWEPGVIAIDAAREVNGLVRELTGHRADLRTLVPAGMAALAVYSWINHPDARLPRWDNLLYWSYNIFTQLHRKEIEHGFRPGFDARGAGSSRDGDAG